MSSPVQEPLEQLPEKAKPISRRMEDDMAISMPNPNEQVYQKLEEKFGRNHQLDVAIEECAELIKALSKAVRGKEDDMKISEEVADVEVCIDQLKLFYDPTGANVALFKRFKIERLRNFFIEGGHR